TGAWSALVYANRLVQVPLGISSTSMSVPMLERFSRAVDAGDNATVQKDLHTALRFLWFLTLPIVALYCVLGRSIVLLLFQGGRFEQQSVELVTLALLFQSPMMFFNVGRDLITGIFKAVSDTHTPFRVACLVLLCNAFFDWLFVFVLRMDVAGIALATTVVSAINFLILLLILRMRIHLGIRKLVPPLLKMIVGTCACMYAAQLTLSFLSNRLPTDSKVALCIEIFGSIAVGLSAYLIVSWLLRVSELGLIWNQSSEALIKLLKR
ncbi:MAG: murein biosynthesis integral membrane protein MurJ, partial [Terriglobales bacterium]